MDAKSLFRSVLRLCHVKDYLWAMRTFQEKAGLLNISCIITDRENALINALRTICPEIPCRWHVNKNVTAKCRTQLDSEDAWTVFQEKWYKTIDAKTVDEFNTAWQEIQDFCAPSIRNYLESTWYPVREKIVKAWTNAIPHMDNDTTSIAEGTHSFIKKFLGSSKSDILLAVDRINLGLDSQDTALRSEINKQKSRHLKEFSQPLFESITRKVSYFALRKIGEQRRLLLSASNESPLPPCTRHFYQSLGLPCAHMIKVLLEQNAPLQLSDIHPHWHLRTHGVLEPFISQAPQIVFEPDVVSSLRGRPNGRQALSSTRRNPSLFELVEQSQGSQRRCRHCQQTGHNRRTCPVAATSSQPI